MKKGTFRISKTVGVCVLAALASVSLFAKPNGERGRGQSDGAQMKGAQHSSGFYGQRQGKKGNRRPDSAMMLIRMSEKLDLTNEQEAQLLALSQDHRAEMKSHRKAMSAAKEKMKALRESKEFDEEALRAALAEIQPIMTDGIVLRGKYKNEISKVLTDEQTAKIAKFKKSKRTKMGKAEKTGRGDREKRKYRKSERAPKGDLE